VSWNNVHLRPSGCAGWNDAVATGFAGSINVSHIYSFQHFLQQWSFGFGVRQAFDLAAGSPDVRGLGTSHLKVFGSWGLGLNAFNQRYSLV
jgi:hypothetical protein